MASGLRRGRAVPVLVGLLLATAAAGCGGDPGARLDARSPSRKSFAQVVIVLERGDRQGDDVVWKTQASAHFVQPGALGPADVATLLGLPAMTGVDELAEGACRPRLEAEAIDDALGRGDGNRVELLDAGEVVLRAASGARPLVPRELPGLLGLVDGFAYHAEAELALPALDRSELHVEAAGSSRVGAFAASAPLPHPLRIEEVGGQPADGALPLPIDPSSDLEVRWRPATGDLVFLDVGGPRGQLSCRVRDDGRFVIPGRLLRQALAGDRTVHTASRFSGQLRVARLARTPFFARGIEVGELVVAVRATVPLWVAVP